MLCSGQERLDRRQDRGHVSRLGEGALRGDRLFDERAERRRVARLDVWIASAAASTSGLWIVAGLAEVGRGAEVLDGVGELGDLRRRFDRELPVGLRGRRPAELRDGAFQRVDVRRLLGAEGLDQAPTLPLNSPAAMTFA